MFGDQYSNAILILIAASIALIYFYVKRVYSYWQHRGVPQLKPIFPFGDGGKIFYQRLSLIEQMDEWYHSTTEPFLGVYTFFQPLLIVRDPELIRDILIKNFHHFTDRVIPMDEENDPLSAHLFNMKGEKWRNLRAKLTPTFTSGKIRSIFTTLLELNQPLLKHIEQMANSNLTVECYNLAVNHTTNGIISAGFGIDIDCFADPATPFRKYGRRISQPSLKNTLRIICSILCPKLKRLIGIHNIDRDVEEFMYDVMRQLMELRQKNSIVRKDFFDLLVQLLNTGSVQLDDEWNTVSGKNESTKSYTIEEVTAQALIFFVAGSETSATTIAFCLYELAKNPNVQQRLHEEIDSVLTRNNGQFTYDSINGMKYLGSCIDETLRKYCVFATLNRECTKDYRIPGTTVTLQKGTSIIIPIFSLQRDKKYYPAPLKFDPTRFFDKNSKQKTFADQPYLPFGDGPRSCIGMRMGKLMAQIAIAAILQQYNVELGEQHTDDNELKLGFITLPPKSGINLKFKRRH